MVVNALNATGLIQIHVSWCVQTVCGGARDSSRPPPHVCWLIGNHSLSTAGARDIRSIVIIIIFSWSVESEGVEFAAQ